MVCYLLRKQSETEEAKLKKLQHQIKPAEAKATWEWLETYGCGATNGDATDKLVAALDGCDCDTCKDIVKNKDFLAKKSRGSSEVTDGLMISDSAALTMYWQAAKISTSWYSTPRGLFQHRWTGFKGY